MKNFLIVCGLLMTEVFGLRVYAVQATYDEVEIAKLSAFLRQESAIPGVRNYEILGLTSMENIDWGSVKGLSFNSLTYYLEFMRWQELNLSGHLDLTDFKGLRYVYLQFNDIKSISVMNCPILYWLDLYTNDLQKIDVSTNPALYHLRLGYNNIPTLDLSNNPYLNFLCCTNNQLETLDVSNKTGLHTLYCVGNNLHTLHVDNCTGLETFLCDFNQLETLNVINMTNLKIFACSGNGMKDLQLINCVSLEDISCNNNELSELDFSNYEYLSAINCSKNNITSINLKGCTSLTSLLCEYNMISSLDITDSPLLSTLLCRNNYLTFLTLPLPSQQLTNYTYSPQAYVELDCEYNNVNFTDIYRINDNISRFIWKYGYTTITPLANNEGLFTFDESYVGETIICEALNSALPLLVMHYDVTFTREETGNANPETGKPAVYASGQTIHVITGSSATVSIYSLQGKLIMKRKVEAGRTGIPIERGMYVAVVNDQSRYKLIVR